ncbi:MAG: hypothetical protein JWO87_1560 [Phycisphaerales bacterium]|nr:hypothetical protein [Phycisphaerales bacterium]
MRILVALLAVAAVFGVVSCGGTNPPPPGTTQAPLIISPGPARPDTATVPMVRTQSQAPANADVPPPDAHYTISCVAIKGATHVQQSVAVKDKLIRESHMTGWHIVHAEQQSILCYGYYREYRDEKKDPQETARARADQHRLAELNDGMGNRYFAQCVFVPINEPDPDAPSQWDLVRTPGDAFWSVQVGAYQGSPERKKFAVDAVREMRAKNIPAYYYHGETVSSICVGWWPRTAIQEQGVGVNRQGQARDEANTKDPSQPIVVLPGVISPKVADEVANRINQNGNHALVAQERVEILDQTLLQTLKDYPNHFVNGDFHFRLIKGQKVFDPSFLVQIPHTGTPPPAGIVNDVVNAPPERQDGAADQAVNDLLGGGQNRPALGQLHSLDDPAGSKR